MKKHFLIFTLSLLFFSLAQGKVRLPAMMGDHMVLQKTVLSNYGDGQTVKSDCHHFLEQPDLQR